MNWIDAALFLALLLGLGAGGFMVARSPVFWIGFGKALFAALAPAVFAYITKRMDPATEAAWRECERRGGKWNHIKKRCE